MKDIYDRLGLKTDLDTEKKKFLNRIRRSANILVNDLPSDTYEVLNYEVCFRLGLDEDDDLLGYIEEADFDEALIWCEITLESLHNDRSYRDALEVMIVYALEKSMVDLNITYDIGKFRRKAAEELDQALLTETLSWLKDRPTTKKFFNDALAEYFRKDYPDAITKCYSALESLAKEYLQSDKRLDKLVPDLVAKLNLSGVWRSILFQFCQYAHEYASRHGKREGVTVTNLNPLEVEAYVYQTGLVLRVICQASNKA